MLSEPSFKRRTAFRKFLAEQQPFNAHVFFQVGPLQRKEKGGVAL
jgi:hypothetical protein